MDGKKQSEPPDERIDDENSLDYDESMDNATGATETEATESLIERYTEDAMKERQRNVNENRVEKERKIMHEFFEVHKPKHAQSKTLAAWSRPVVRKKVLEENEVESTYCFKDPATGAAVCTATKLRITTQMSTHMPIEAAMPRGGVIKKGPVDMKRLDDIIPSTIGFFDQEVEVEQLIGLTQKDHIPRLADQELVVEPFFQRRKNYFEHTDDRQSHSRAS